MIFYFFTIVIVLNRVDSTVKDPRTALTELESKISLTSTGTTIVGFCCTDGVVLGADTRATGGNIVVDKEKLKVHPISPRIFACGAGTSADCDQITKLAGLSLAKLRIEKDLAGIHSSIDNVLSACISISSQIMLPTRGKKPQSVFIVGGIDDCGPSLYEIQMDGTYEKCEFSALGSGSLSAISVIETKLYSRNNSNVAKSSFPNDAELKYDDENINSVMSDWVKRVPPLTVEEAIPIVKEAIFAGICHLFFVPI